MSGNNQMQGQESPQKKRTKPFVLGRVTLSIVIEPDNEIKYRITSKNLMPKSAAREEIAAAIADARRVLECLTSGKYEVKRRKGWRS